MKQDLRQDLRSIRRVPAARSPVHVIGGGLSGAEAARLLSPKLDGEVKDTRAPAA